MNSKICLREQLRHQNLRFDFLVEKLILFPYSIPGQNLSLGHISKYDELYCLESSYKVAFHSILLAFPSVLQMGSSSFCPSSP